MENGQIRHNGDGERSFFIEQPGKASLIKHMSKDRKKTKDMHHAKGITFQAEGTVNTKAQSWQTPKNQCGQRKMNKMKMTAKTEQIMQTLEVIIRTFTFLLKEMRKHQKGFIRVMAWPNHCGCVGRLLTQGADKEVTLEIISWSRCWQLRPGRWQWKLMKCLEVVYNLKVKITGLTHQKRLTPDLIVLEFNTQLQTLIPRHRGTHSSHYFSFRVNEVRSLSEHLYIFGQKRAC